MMLQGLPEELSAVLPEFNRLGWQLSRVPLAPRGSARTEESHPPGVLQIPALEGESRGT